jgi:hypothetical protein
MMTPALLMRNEPAAKISSKATEGLPLDASTIDHNVGSISSQVPDWFLRRISDANPDQKRAGSAGGTADTQGEEEGIEPSDMRATYGRA